MANYNRIKATKSVPIGTIMPWTGSSSTSRLVDDSIPNGWIVCRGQTLRAIDYPLLAQLLGNEYGPFSEVGGPAVGIQNDYPYYGEDDYFNLPNLNQTSLVDLEGSRLDVEDIVVVGQYITKNGSDAAPLNLITSYVDVNFQIEPDSQLSGRLTGVTLQEPAFFDTYTVIPRKLGVIIHQDILTQDQLTDIIHQQVHLVVISHFLLQEIMKLKMITGQQQLQLIIMMLIFQPIDFLQAL